MRYLLLNSLLLLTLASCSSAYRGLMRLDNDMAPCLERFRPKIEQPVLYATQVDVLQHHLSGLLYFKPMEDSSMRVVFMSEMGMKFFDFEFSKDGRFTKHYMLPKMDKKAVVKTLRKDFEMILMRQDPATATLYTMNGQRYIAFDLPKGKIYYITDGDCQTLLRVENGSKRKPVVEAFMTHYRNGVPDSLLVQHKKVKFTISSQRVEK
ncbi:hypothetical protein [Chitinophaga barathri]|uniref:DUF4292 domain-containing protein n=1 Tax=Chitinophaga barathri TaxID=1647451 RepID=A0A3N4MAY1_9BACT|nr:hypothetical protein [Chitinophaga barathri]RPD40952.1 hypothetical protein EG028_13135 [Chitinophaga barathri]